MAEFEAFPKIPRLNRDITITEKIDGTNAAVIIEDLDETDRFGAHPDDMVIANGRRYWIQAQSRKRLITPGKQTDNYGFAGWVRSNAAELVELLGPGRHFGEWWGTGIARGYGLMSQRRFSLFNVGRWGARPDWAPLRLSPVDGMTADTIVDVVPVLYEGPFLPASELEDGAFPPWDQALWELRFIGSKAVPGFRDPEGVIIYHSAANQLFKVTCKDDEKPKGSQE